MDIASYKLNNLNEEDYERFKLVINEITGYFGLEDSSNDAISQLKSRITYAKNNWRKEIRSIKLNVGIICNKSSWRDKSEVKWENNTNVSADLLFLKPDQILNIVGSIDKSAINGLKITLAVNDYQCWRIQPRKIFEGKKKIEDFSEIFSKEKAD